jgi:transcriptional regulator with XRE-family HTH domain
MEEKKLGLFIKSKRLQLGLNRPEFSELTTVDADYLNNIEQGRVPSTNQLLKIAEGLGIRPGVLLDVLAGYDEKDSDINSLNSIRLPEVLLSDPADRMDIEDYIAFKAQKRLRLNQEHNKKLTSDALLKLSNEEMVAEDND